MYLASFILLIVAFIAALIIESNTIEVTRFTISSDKLVNKFKGKKIIQISDLHGKSFGKNNSKLIDKINYERPDVIFVTGDMVEADKKDYTAAYELLKALSEKYKVYYITGNHEHKALIKKNREIYMEYFKKVKDLNIHRLNNQKYVVNTDFKLVRCEDIVHDIDKDTSDIKDKNPSEDKKTSSSDKQKKYRYFNLYGLILPFDTYRYLLSNRSAREVNYDYIQKKLGDLNTDECNILLAHNPLYFKEYVKWGADFVFSGHVHGGIIRIPKVGGLLSPDRTFFPKYSFGKYKEDNTTMIVSKGLGGSAIGVRINCKPEIVSIKFV